jgi:hypothetical protein
MSEKLLGYVRERMAHAQNKALLKEKYEAKMVFPFNGGLFRAGPDLLAVLQCCQPPTAVIVDLYGTPIEVDIEKMKTEAYSLWQEQMNAWQVEFAEAAKKR